MYMIIENQILVCIITHILLAVRHFHLKNKILIFYQYCESLNVLATTIFAFNMRKSQMNIYMVTEEFLSALILLPCFPASHLSLQLEIRETLYTLYCIEGHPELVAGNRRNMTERKLYRGLFCVTFVIEKKQFGSILSTQL